jgi:RNA polymerase sigma factor (sigma-70 family)
MTSELRNIPLRRRHKWRLTSDAFAALLATLAPDSERAGEEYEKLRRKLTKFFTWEGCAFAEEYADETINRIAKRIGEGQLIQDINSYCYATARLVLLEAHKERRREQHSLAQLKQEVGHPDASVDDNDPLACLQQCLAHLAPETRTLIIEYYQGEKSKRIENREALAAQLKIPLNALRNRVLRLRARLERCVKKCLNGLENA